MKTFLNNDIIQDKSINLGKIDFGDTNTLPEAYIPDTIARKSDLEGLGSGSLTAEEVSSTEPTAEFPQVLYTAQELSDAQKSQARENIGVDKELEVLIGAMGEAVNGLAETIAANYPTRQEVSDAIASAITNVLNEEV